jgi:hypothetical protein
MQINWVLLHPRSNKELTELIRMNSTYANELQIEKGNIKQKTAYK